MNKIVDLFQKIDDIELQKAVNEIKEDNDTGIIRDGVVRKYAKLSADITGNNISTELFMTEINILRQAAFRWVPVSYDLMTDIKNGTHKQFVYNTELTRVDCRCGHPAVWWKTGFLCGTITAYPCKYN